MLTEFSTELLTFALDEVTQQNMTRASLVLSRLSHLKFLHCDPAWYIDSDIDMPYVEALLNYLYYSSSSELDSNNSSSTSDTHSNNHDGDDDDEDEDNNIVSIQKNGTIKKTLPNNSTDTSTLPTSATANVTTKPRVKVRIHHSLSTGLEYEVETNELRDSHNTKEDKEDDDDDDNVNTNTDLSEDDELESVAVSRDDNNNDNETDDSDDDDDDDDDGALNKSNFANIDNNNTTSHNINHATKTKKNNRHNREQIDKTHHKCPDFERLYRNALKQKQKQMTRTGNANNNFNSEQEDREQLKTKHQQQQLIFERRFERREYMNYEHFKTYLKSWVPSVCSLCFRSASLTVDVLSSQTVEKMITREAQKLVNSSSLMRIKKRHHDHDHDHDQFNKQHSHSHAVDGNNMLGGIKVMKHTYYSILLDMLQNFKDNNEFHRQSQLQTLASVAGLPTPLADSLVNFNDRKMHMDLPGLELVLIKRLKPVQDLFVKLFGIEMKIPLSENILFELLALMLQRNHPHFV